MASPSGEHDDRGNQAFRRNPNADGLPRIPDRRSPGRGAAANQAEPGRPLRMIRTDNSKGWPYLGGHKSASKDERRITE